MNQDEDFRALATAAMRVGAGMMAALSEDQQTHLGGAILGGARLYIEFGPLPLFDGARLVLVEAEGRRHHIGALTVREGPPQ